MFRSMTKECLGAISGFSHDPGQLTDMIRRRWGSALRSGVEVGNRGYRRHRIVLLSDMSHFKTARARNGAVLHKDIDNGVVGVKLIHQVGGRASTFPR